MATTSTSTVPAAPTVTSPSFALNKIDYEKLNEFEFKPPPECPVYRPTQEEFDKGPLEYINSIRPVAEKHGICKIIPPKSFKVPFSIDTKEFTFTPRVQRLNELEARTRVKLIFHDRLIKFWQYQGVILKWTTFEKKLLDLHTLHSVVKEEGGFELCTQERKWAKIALRLNFTKKSSSSLHQYYEKTLFPYDLFINGATCEATSNDEPHSANGYDNNSDVKNDTTDETKSYEMTENADPQNTELRKLQVFGAGPKMPGVTNDEKVAKGRICHNCSDSNSSPMLTCDYCTRSFHRACLFPPFNEVPKNQWNCHSCLAKILPKLPQLYTNDFGFIQSGRIYKLSEFCENANAFKASYFNQPPHKVPLDIVEKEFWRIVSSSENIVHVEYGADLDNDFGSGFPLKKQKKNDNDEGKENIMEDPELEYYVNSPWNLNNLPTLDGSVFKHINTNINGMIIPWMYVGMCFSAFCWHNEDHWTYSINYLHWGEPKIWYGVPGNEADKFEEAMQKVAPELFIPSPDLLHRLVTTCNPNILSKEHGVPIYKAVQEAGEFIVTFPRSYHSGFNQGFNFAEAVNFATRDWLNLGRLSVANYALSNRFTVFSHDELICKMADSYNRLDMQLARETYNDLLMMAKNERELRDRMNLMGIISSERYVFETMGDDNRSVVAAIQPVFCLLCAASAQMKRRLIKKMKRIKSVNKAKPKLVCLNHYDHLCSKCSCEDFTLLYRYSMDELKVIIVNLRKFIEDDKEWIIKTESEVK
ncbi:Lysine-specific demethylase 5A, partial [Tyrophagus putrescentiae]